VTPEAQSFSAVQLWAAFKRRWLPALALAVAIVTGSILAAIFWPASYSATGTILIEQQELPIDLVRSTVSTYATQRIQIISQRVMTTEELMGIIQRYNLYPELRKSKPREEIIATMRRAVNLQMISADVIDPRSGSPTKATIAFSITYSNRSPQLAAEVANELVSLYLQQNIEAREKSSRDAVTFISGESARLDADINQIQGELAAFKSKHANELPELSQLNLTGVNQMQDQLLETDARLQSISQQLLFLDSQLAQINPTAQVYTSSGERVQSPADLLKSLRSQYARDSALYTPNHPDVIRLKRQIANLEASVDADKSGATLNDYRRQLEDTKTQLADALHRYSPDYPDVVQLQRLVDSLQAQVDAQSLKASKDPKSSAPDADTEEARVNADNPAYVQLRAQRQGLTIDRKNLEERRVALQEKQNEYQQRLARTPAVEREYTEILRRLNSAQAQYGQLRAKQMEADVAENLETERKGEHFTLIEPPIAPEEPTSPNRGLIILFGLVAALGSALGVVILLETLDGSIRGRQQLQALISVPPLAVIPIMLTHDDLVLRRRHRLYALYSVFGCCAIAVIAVHFLYRPLDVIWAVALRHLGG
jgi:succinoglycan biosynthesis transport protein ExoP